MRTSKIKVVHGSKPWKDGISFYKLEMENGDKIEIGKKSDMKVGYELTYNITGDEQQEYRKAKSVKPEERPASSPQGRNSPDVQASIVAQFCIREANLFLLNRGVGSQMETTVGEYCEELGKAAFLIHGKVKEIENAILKP